MLRSQLDLHLEVCPGYEVRCKNCFKMLKNGKLTEHSCMRDFRTQLYKHKYRPESWLNDPENNFEIKAVHTDLTEDKAQKLKLIL